MSGNHSSTREHNKEFIMKTLGVTQVPTTTLFINNDIFLFSPAVDKNKKTIIGLIYVKRILKKKKN